MKGDRIHTIVLIGLVLLAGCRPKKVPSPKEMELILYDLHYTDGVLNEAGLLYGHEDDMKAYYAAALAKHGLTQAQFDSALVWYTNHSVQFEKIYPKVQARLERRLEFVREIEEGVKHDKKHTRQLTPEQLSHELIYGLPHNWPETRQRFRINPILLLEKKK